MKSNLIWAIIWLVILPFTLLGLGLCYVWGIYEKYIQQVDY